MPDTGNVPIQLLQGGSIVNVASGGTILVASGGSIQIAAGGALHQRDSRGNTGVGVNLEIERADAHGHGETANNALLLLQTRAIVTRLFDGADPDIAEKHGNPL